MWTVAASHGDVIHTVRFVQDPVLVVWSEDGSTQSGSRIDLAGAPASAPQINLPGAGTLDPVATNHAMVSKVQRFRVASNSGFQIKISAQGLPEMSAEPISVALYAPGKNADASLAGSTLTRVSLADLSTERVIFTAPTKTALQSGSPDSQSIEIEIDFGAQPAGEINVWLEAISK